MTLTPLRVSQPSILPSPSRISITIPHALHQALLKRSDCEGRSLSNLCAFLLEGAMATPQPR